MVEFPDDVICGHSSCALAAKSDSLSSGMCLLATGAVQLLQSVGSSDKGSEEALSRKKRVNPWTTSPYFE